MFWEVGKGRSNARATEMLPQSDVTLHSGKRGWAYIATVKRFAVAVAGIQHSKQVTWERGE